MTISYEIQIQVNLPLSSHHSSVSRLFFKSSTMPLNFSFLLRFLQVIEFSSFASIIRRKLQQSSSYKAHVNISRVFSCTFIYLFVNIDQSLNNFGAHHSNTLKKSMNFIVTIIFITVALTLPELSEKRGR